MDGLRVILLILGVVVIAGVYFLARRQNGKASRQQARKEQLEPVLDLDAVEVDPQDFVEHGRKAPATRSDGFDEEPSEERLAEELTRMQQVMQAQSPQESSLSDDEPLVISPSKSRIGSRSSTAATASQPDPITVAASSPAKAGIAQPSQEKIIALHVMAPSHTPFRGKDLLKAFELAGLQYGDMNIYHRMLEVDGTMKDAYFVANLVKPGTFKPASMEQFTSPGISLILQLPGPVEGMRALDDMVATAQQITAELNGELRDETRSVLSRQRIEHLRGEVMEFQRKLRLQRAKA